MREEYKILTKALDLALIYSKEELLEKMQNIGSMDVAGVIINEVCKELQANVDELYKRTRRNPTVLARQMSMHFMNIYCDWMTLKNIANYFNLMDHSTVVHANKVISDYIFMDANRERYEKIKRRIDLILCT